MKKILALSIATSLFLTPNSDVAKASSVQTDIQVNMNGSRLSFPDAKPFIDQNNRTLVPVRFVAENLGAKVVWHDDIDRVDISVDGKYISLTIGEKVAFVNGEEVAFDTAAVIRQDRTFVPLRFVSEALGISVEWDRLSNNIWLGEKKFQENNPSGLFDPYGREIRTTNLPKNHKDFPYILADVPNEMYEMKYAFSPRPEKFKSTADLYKNTPEFTFENVDKWMGRVTTYYDLILNVDYKTIDDSWGPNLFPNINQMVNKEHTLRTYSEYVAWVKKNKIKIVGSVTPMPSMVYYTGWEYRVRAKIEFNIVSYTENKNVLFDERYNEQAKNIKKNIWYEGHIEVALGTNVYGDWGDSLAVMGKSIWDNALISETEK